MTGTVGLGRVAGIEIKAHWTLLVIAGLIWLGLAADILPSLDPGHGAPAYWVMGVIIVVLFYASLVAHELSHSIVARRHGVGVKQITLWLFGGVSELTSESHSGIDELVIAIVGPAMSFALGVVFGVLAVASSAADSLGLVTASLAWLAVINIVLAVFNLLPAFPLDGGRVLRAILWEWRDDEVEATRMAATVSNVAAYGLVALGFVMFLAGAGLGGLWFAILGWFVLNAARAETQQILTREALDDLPVSRLMSPHPVTVPADLTVTELIEHFLLGHRYSSYPVIDHAGRPVGIVTLDAIRRVPAAQRPTAPLRDVMFGMDEVPLLGPDDLARETLPVLVPSPVGRALVLDHGQLVGILSLTDLARAVEQRSIIAGRPSPSAR